MRETLLGLQTLLCREENNIAIKFSGELWQFVTAILDESGEVLTLCKQLSQGYDCAYWCVTFKVLLESFCCNLTDMGALLVHNQHLSLFLVF